VGTTTKELDAIHDLIKFDHVYVKSDQDMECPDINKIRPSVSESVLSIRDIENIEKILDSQLVPGQTAPTDLSVRSSNQNLNVYESGLYSVECQLSDSGYSDASSPYSHSVSSPSANSTSSILEDGVWEESFSELFPNLV